MLVNSGIIGFLLYYSLTIYSSFFAENMQKSVTLSASQLNNNTYEYFSNKLDNLDDNTTAKDGNIKKSNGTS